MYLLLTRDDVERCFKSLLNELWGYIVGELREGIGDKIG